jgi:hypothetical protein
VGSVIIIMDNFEIKKCFKRCGFFRGVFMSNTIPARVRKRVRKKRGGIIVNLDTFPSNGTHWVAIWFNGDGSGEYFDSFASPIPPSLPELHDFLRDSCPLGWSENKTTLQHNTSSSCALYCTFFLKHRCLGASFKHIISHFSQTKGLNELIVTMLDPKCY